VGRDQGIRVPHYDVVDPPVSGRMDNTVWTWVYDDERAPYQQPSYLSQSFVQQVSLMKIAGSIIDVVYSMQSYAREGRLHIGKVIDLQYAQSVLYLTRILMPLQQVCSCARGKPSSPAPFILLIHRSKRVVPLPIS